MFVGVELAAVDVLVNFSGFGRILSDCFCFISGRANSSEWRSKSTN